MVLYSLGGNREVLEGEELVMGRRLEVRPPFAWAGWVAKLSWVEFANRINNSRAPKCSENNYNYFGKQWEPTKNEVKRSHARVTVAAKVIAHKLRPIKNEGFLIIKFHWLVLQK